MSITRQVRTGFGISYESFPDNQYTYNPRVRQNNAYLPTGANPYGFGGVSILPDGTRASLTKGIPHRNPDRGAPNGYHPQRGCQRVSYVVNKNYGGPYVMSYNLTVQQELGRNFVLDTAYAGNQGRQIPAGYNLNADRSQFSFDANLTRSFAFTERNTLRMRLNAFQANEYAAVQQPDHVPYQHQPRLYYKGRRRQSAITACCNAELLMVRCGACEDQRASCTTKVQCDTQRHRKVIEYI